MSSEPQATITITSPPPNSGSNRVFTLVCAVDASIPSLQAFDAAANLVLHMHPSNYRLIVVYIVALNSESKMPYFDHLDKAYNLEIQDEARHAITECKAYLSRYDHHTNLQYEFVTVEGEGEVGPVLHAYLKESIPETDMVVVGTHNYQGLKKMLYGSVSEYCLQNLPYPVTVVKPAASVPGTGLEGVAIKQAKTRSRTSSNASLPQSPTHH
ncbi:hypothetical protein BCR44DRAFT_28252 [Catenaria anguillulae PL171]|uniref:UspA domain-containing protein n=1 Tax=Catenaria anguillulae PL171 TaxID=765915 RepID=A0A1Y2HDD3_9FUNG|nr:hypothetical protein BCR44DRAFT_1465382 [Catenaria anguillulae PL171]ORZ32569.1 hypothetical protein BCR44DRAFT_28252 [Catenaria anguillulae PL171]